MTRFVKNEKGVVRLLISLINILTINIQKMIKITSQQTSVQPRTAVGSGRLSAFDSKHPMTINEFQFFDSFVLFIVFKFTTF